MSKFFRSTNSDSSFSDESSDEASNGSENDIDEVSRVEASQERGLDPLSTALDYVGIQGQSTNNGWHTQMLLHSLLEERCLNDVRREWRSRGSRSDDEAGIQAEARRRYETLCARLAPHNIISSGLENDQLSPVRQRYRDGLTMLSQTQPAMSVNDVERPVLSGRLLMSTQDVSVAQGLLEPATKNSNASSALEALGTVHPVLEPSRYLRDFDELSMLGKGGYGTVYRVKHRLDGNEYAVKKVPISAARMRRLRTRGQQELDDLLLELRTLARLEHPNIVRYFAGWIEWTNAAVHPWRDEACTSNGATSDDAVAGAEDTLSRELKRVVTETDSDRCEVLFEDNVSRPSARTSSGLFEDASAELSNTDGLNGAAEPILAVHLQMGLYPMTLASFLTPSTVAREDTMHHLLDVQEPQDAAVTPGRQHCKADMVQDHRGSHAADTPAFPNTSITESAVVMDGGTISQDCLGGDGAPALVHCFHLQPSLDILLALFDGVEYLHNEGIAHRDLKPTNIFIAPSSNPRNTRGSVDLFLCAVCRASGNAQPRRLQVRIGDFGLVTAMQHGPKAASRAEPVGTELYRPLGATSKGQARLDIFALGVIAFELLWPFSTRMERHDILQQLREGRLPSNFSQRIEDKSGIVERCIRDMVSEDDDSATISTLRHRLYAIHKASV